MGWEDGGGDPASYPIHCFVQQALSYSVLQLFISAPVASENPAPECGSVGHSPFDRRKQEIPIREICSCDFFGNLLARFETLRGFIRYLGIAIKLDDASHPSSSGVFDSEQHMPFACFSPRRETLP